VTCKNLYLLRISTDRLPAGLAERHLPQLPSVSFYVGESDYDDIANETYVKSNATHVKLNVMDVQSIYTDAKSYETDVKLNATRVKLNEMDVQYTDAKSSETDVKSTSLEKVHDSLTLKVTHDSFKG
jgi:hypothetical protein